MTSKELEKKIAAIDKKLERIKLPHGEGTIFWKRKKSCYLGYRKMVNYPDGTSERHAVYEYDLEPLFALMKRDIDHKQEQWRLNHMSLQSVNSNLNIFYDVGVKTIADFVPCFYSTLKNS